MHVPSRHPSTRPFMAAPRTQFYHPAPVIDAALRGTERCIRRAEGVALVVGPPGTGKSLLLAKVAEHVRDDFDVALLSGASICTRRALWQAVMAAIGEPYRGIDETELRIALVERIRGLAATGAGLVILVDEAHTLPTRLIEELRLLTNVPTPLPAVHIVLAGSVRLEEMLGQPRMESLAQRIAVRSYLEPLDHETTMAYLRTQVKAAGLSWDRLFAAGCDDAVFTATDGVPRLVNQLCDQALVLVAESERRVTPADIATAWREIQRLPAPSGLDRAASDRPHPMDDDAALHGEVSDDFGTDGMGVIEFGAGDIAFADEPGVVHDDRGVRGTASPSEETTDPWSGPEVELVFGAGGDPFDQYFDRAERTVERYMVEGPDDFSGCRHVTSREGQSMGRLLASIAHAAPRPAEVEEHRPAQTPAVKAAEPVVMAAGSGDAVEADIDDADMVVIEEDVLPAGGGTPAVFTVRPSDYRSLFTRLRRGAGG